MSNVAQSSKCNLENSFFLLVFFLLIISWEPQKTPSLFRVDTGNSALHGSVQRLLRLSCGDFLCPPVTHCLLRLVFPPVSRPALATVQKLLFMDQPQLNQSHQLQDSQTRAIFGHNSVEQPRRQRAPPAAFSPANNDLMDGLRQR